MQGPGLTEYMRYSTELPHVCFASAKGESHRERRRELPAPLACPITFPISTLTHLKVVRSTQRCTRGVIQSPGMHDVHGLPPSHTKHHKLLLHSPIAECPSQAMPRKGAREGGGSMGMKGGVHGDEGGRGSMGMKGGWGGKISRQIHRLVYKFIYRFI